MNLYTQYDYSALAGYKLKSEQSGLVGGIQKTITYQYANDLNYTELINANMVGVPVQILNNGGAGGGSKVTYSNA